MSPPSGIWAKTDAATTRGAQLQVAREPRDAARDERRDERAEHRPEGDHAVPELHEGVEVLLGERRVATARPVVAAETRGREPDDRAGHHHDEQRAKRDERDEPELLRGERAHPAAGSGEPARGPLRHAHASRTPAPSSTRPILVALHAGLDHGCALLGHGEEQAARGLRVEGEGRESVGNALELRRPGDVVAVPRVAAGPHAGLGRLQRTRQRGQGARVKRDPDAASVGDLVRVAQEPEAGHVGDRARLEGPDLLGGARVRGRHRLGRGAVLVLAEDPFPHACEHETGSERLREEHRICRRARRSFARAHRAGPCPTTASPYFGSSSLIVWPPARIAPASGDLRRGGVEHRPHGRDVELLWKRRDREGEERPPAHREDVVQGVRRGDRAEERRVVDERAERSRP